MWFCPPKNSVTDFLSWNHNEFKLYGKKSKLFFAKFKRTLWRIPQIIIDLFRQRWNLNPRSLQLWSWTALNSSYFIIYLDGNVDWSFQFLTFQDLGEDANVTTWLMTATALLGMVQPAQPEEILQGISNDRIIWPKVENKRNYWSILPLTWPDSVGTVKSVNYIFIEPTHWIWITNRFYCNILWWICGILSLMSKSTCFNFA